MCAESKRRGSYVRAVALSVFLNVGLACGDPTVAPSAEPEDDAEEKALPGTWTSLAQMPNARNHLTAAALNDVVYVAGGNAGPLNLAPPTAVLAYLPASDTWRTVGHLTRGVRSPGMAATNNRIHVIGGFRDNPFEATSLVQIFDPQLGTVTIGPPMPTRRGAPAVAVLDGRIHVIGGMMDDEYDVMGVLVTAHEAFDPMSRTWSAHAPLPVVSQLHGAVALDGKIYVAAGMSDGRIHVYDAALNAWSVAAPASSDRPWFNRAIAAHGGKIYFFGGAQLPATCCLGPSPRQTARRFDPHTAMWEQLAPMPTARFGHAVAVVGDVFYVIGGSPTGPYTSFSAANERFTPR